MPPPPPPPAPPPPPLMIITISIYFLVTNADRSKFQAYIMAIWLECVKHCRYLVLRPDFSKDSKVMYTHCQL